MPRTPREKGTLACEACHRSFRYRLVHAGFNDCAYAYCDRCGMTAILSAYGHVPESVAVRWHEVISVEIEANLRQCPCAGRFRRGAGPRCPACKAPLEANSVAASIEADAPGAAKGWRWQRSWTGLYFLILDERLVEENWLG